ncbi:MAG: YbjQ family protein [Actinomycetota bacterium]|nr:YbjQ family protein [Actinomycetota bacterium]
MHVSTTFEVSGFRITQSLGPVFGLTVRSRNVGSQLGSQFKAIVGGELKGMTKNLTFSRSEAIQRLIEEAQKMGADAVVGMRFDNSDFANVTEICAYGTAVKLAPLS